MSTDSKTTLRRAPLDEIDRDILAHIHASPNGTTISEIHRAVCPLHREPFVRYRVDRLHSLGRVKVTRVFGRIVVLPPNTTEEVVG